MMIFLLPQLQIVQIQVLLITLWLSSHTVLIRPAITVQVILPQDSTGLVKTNDPIPRDIAVTPTRNPDPDIASIQTGDPDKISNSVASHSIRLGRRLIVRRMRNN